MVPAYKATNKTTISSTFDTIRYIETLFSANCILKALGDKLEFCVCSPKCIKGKKRFVIFFISLADSNEDIIRTINNNYQIYYNTIHNILKRGGK